MAEYPEVRFQTNQSVLKGEVRVEGVKDSYLEKLVPSRLQP